MADYIDGLAKLPEYMRDGMRLYIERGVPQGSFLTFVLENNLVRAFGQADIVNRHAMFNYADFLWNDAPTGCWGSPAKVKRWIELGGLVGMSGVAQGAEECP